MGLRATDRVAISRMARRRSLAGFDLADETRMKVERANQRMFITLVLIDRARRHLAACRRQGLGVDPS